MISVLINFLSLVDFDYWIVPPPLVKTMNDSYGALLLVSKMKFCVH